MALDISKLSANFDPSSLLPKNGNVISDSALSQWSMLRANGKALAASLAAEKRGYLRDSEAPQTPLQSERVLDPKDRSTTIADVLKMLGREPAAVVDLSDAAKETTANTATDTKTAAETTQDTADAKDSPDDAGTLDLYA